MITEFLIKKAVIPIIKKMFLEMFDQQAKVWKFRENNDYRELPNEADRRLDVLEEKFGMMIEDIHPPQDFPISKEQVDELLGFMKKMKNTRKFKLGG